MQDERPIAVPSTECDVVIPDGYRAARVEFITPEKPEPVELALEVAGNRARFTAPEFLVYGVARIHLEGGGSARAAAPVLRRREKVDTAAARRVVHEQYQLAEVRSAPFEPFDHAECSQAF